MDPCMHWNSIWIESPMGDGLGIYSLLHLKRYYLKVPHENGISFHAVLMSYVL